MQNLKIGLEYIENLADSALNMDYQGIIDALFEIKDKAKDLIDYMDDEEEIE